MTDKARTPREHAFPEGSLAARMAIWLFHECPSEYQAEVEKDVALVEAPRGESEARVIQGVGEGGYGAVEPALGLLGRKRLCEGAQRGADPTDAGVLLHELAIVVRELGVLARPVDEDARRDDGDS